MTDNRVRTVAEVRHALTKYGGNLGTDGSVAFQFKHCGQFLFAPGTSEDKVMEAALEAGAEDVIANDDGAIEVIWRPRDFEKVARRSTRRAEARARRGHDEAADRNGAHRRRRRQDAEAAGRARRPRRRAAGLHHRRDRRD